MFFRSQTALHKAAAAGDRKIVPLLVAAGASIQSPDIDGLTPKMLAIKFEKLDVASYFERKYTYYLQERDFDLRKGTKLVHLELINLRVRLNSACHACVKYLENNMIMQNNTGWLLGRF